MRVSTWIEHPSDVTEFVKTVGRFSKKFYTVRHKTTPNYKFINIVALGISRDLTYIVRWGIMANTDEEMEKEYLENPHSVYGDDVAPYGLLPLNDQNKTALYPCLDIGNYVDVFHYNGFIKVVQIHDENGKELVVD